MSAEDGRRSGRPQAGLEGGCGESSYKQVKPIHGPPTPPIATSAWINGSEC